MTKLIIDLDELNLRELFETRRERARDVIQRAVRQAIPCQINMHATVGKLNFAIACETIIDPGKTLIPFYITRSLKELIENRIDYIL